MKKPESYSPGPWEACDLDGQYFPHVNLGPPVPYHDGSGFHQPYVIVNTSRFQTMAGAIANAHLIAAAPDLLEAAKQALLIIENHKAADKGDRKRRAELLRKAINKAKGIENK